MIDQAYGATPAEWKHFAETLGLLKYILPVASDPHAEISETSSLKTVGKVPSLLNFRGKVAGFPQWTSHVTTADEINQWQLDERHGFCIRSAGVRAFDIDVGHKATAKRIARWLDNELPYLCLPRRTRSNSGKLLIPFRYEGDLTKHVIPVEGGMIELLADGQQFVAAGTHPSGVRYEWTDGLPNAIPLLDKDELDRLLRGLVLAFHDPAGGAVKVARQRRLIEGDAAAHGGGADEVAEWLMANWTVFDTGADDRVFIECPFVEEHTGDSGPTACCYFPAKTGGYQQGHFKCQHSHCQARTDGDFLQATGYAAAQFDDLDAEHEAQALEQTALVPVQAVPRIYALPKLTAGTKAGYKPTLDNLVRALESCGFIDHLIVYDSFRDEVMIAPASDAPGEENWRPFEDVDYGRLQIIMEQKRILSPSIGALRMAVDVVAHRAVVDSAKVWLSRQHWDGTPRIERFMIDCLGCEDTPYTRAVGRYLWTGLAGRVMDPGVQADMAVILQGEQGQQKTSAIKAMVPDPQFYTSIDFRTKEADMSRKLRGTLIGELEELRGLNSRQADEIKAFISRTHEEWVPKFKEKRTMFARRCLFIGTTNEEEFLADATGERRYLPAQPAVGGGRIDVALIKAAREQLWAEGADAFLVAGVDWREAEKLAVVEHAKVKIHDPWESKIDAWLHEEGVDGIAPADFEEGVTTMDVAIGLGLKVGEVDRAKETRIGKSLRNLGFVKFRKTGATKRSYRRVECANVPTSANLK